MVALKLPFPGPPGPLPHLPKQERRGGIETAIGRPQPQAFLQRSRNAVVALKRIYPKGRRPLR